MNVGVLKNKEIHSIDLRQKQCSGGTVTCKWLHHSKVYCTNGQIAQSCPKHVAVGSNLLKNE